MGETYRIDQRQIPVVGEILPGDRVGVTRMISIIRDRIGFCDLLAKDQRGLDCQIHDHNTLGTEPIRKNLQRVCD